MLSFRKFINTFRRKTAGIIPGGGFRLSGYLIAIAVIAVAGDKPKISIRVVETQASDRHVSYETPGAPAESTTHCTENSGYGAVITGGPGVDCTTKTTPATAAHRDTITIQQANVLAVFPGDKHVTLWCQRGFRKCADLDAGTYAAEVDGDIVWVSVPSGLNGKITKIKYHYNGSW